MDSFVNRFDTSSLYTTVRSTIRDNRKAVKVIGVIAALYVVRKVVYRFWRKWNNYPPGPSGLPWFGSLFSILKSAPNYASYLASNYGSISMIYIGNQPFVFLNSIDTINEVLKGTDALDRDSWHNTFTFSHMNESEMFLPLANEKYWYAKRRYFQINLMSKMDPNFLNIVHNMSLTSHVFKFIDSCIEDGRLWHFAKDVDYLIFHISWYASFGTFLEFGSDEQNNMMTFFKRSSTDLTVDIFLRYLQISILLPKFITNEIFSSAKDTELFLKTQLYKHLGYDDSVFDRNEHKWDEHFQEVRQDNSNACVAAKIIASFRESSDIFTSVQAAIVSIAIFFYAGVHSSVQTMEYTLVLLAKNPREQQRIYQEIATVVGDDDIMTVNTESMVSIIRKLHLLRAFFQESLRLSSVSVLGVAHCNSKCDIIVKSGKRANGESYECRIPKGSVIFPHIHHANTTDIYWQQRTGGKAGEVCLDAWLDSNGRFKPSLNKGKMLAFGTGTRNCAGITFALKIELFLFAKLLMRYEFLLPIGMKCNVQIKQVYEFGYVMKPKIPLRVLKRS